MNLLQLLRDEGEKLVEAEIPAVSEVARVVAALVKYEERKLAEAEHPPASIETPIAPVAPTPVAPTPVAPTPVAPAVEPTNSEVLNALAALNARLDQLPTAQ